MQGILIKGGDVLERGAGVNVVLFDKTGTLTFGTPVVVGLLQLRTTPSHLPPADKQGAATSSLQRLLQSCAVPERELLAMLGSLEVHCDHPLARAVVNWADVCLAGPGSGMHADSVTGGAHGDSIVLPAGGMDSQEVAADLVQVWPTCCSC